MVIVNCELCIVNYEMRIKIIITLIIHNYICRRMVIMNYAL